jgi:transposase
MLDINTIEISTTPYKSPLQERRHTRYLDADDVALILELAKENLKAYEIATKFGTTAKRIKSICNEAGVEVISKDNQKNKRAKQILALLQNGYKTQQIMNLVDCDREFIAQIRFRYGLAKPSAVARERCINATMEVTRLIANGRHVKDACKLVGISDATYYRYKKAMEENSRKAS